MYIEKLVMENIRTFARTEMHFVHPDLVFRGSGASDSKAKKLLPKPNLPNVNLLLGENATGKTTVLQAIALAVLGPAARDTQLPLRRLVRSSSNGEPAQKNASGSIAYILATLFRHESERAGKGLRLSADEGEPFESMQEFKRLGEIDAMEFAGIDNDGTWAPVYESNNATFFAVAYGSNRRVESVDSPAMAFRERNPFGRAQRVLSAFQDGFLLYRLANWLPRLKKSNPGRYREVLGLMENMIGPGHFHLTENVTGREYEFKRGETRVPFPSLSDGYRGFIGWAGDLFYHLNEACPLGQFLVDLPGVVMVDEIDLLLHPKWQMKVIKTVAMALPRMQFIFTSHSPLVAGSLEWMNINLLKVGTKTNRTVGKRLRQSIHGLDADQILLSEFFGLKSTMAPGKVSQLSQLQRKARHGDRDAARQIILAMAKGNEDAE
jgi:AAA domain, putative AbiEii toxin, Type IV TA system